MPAQIPLDIDLEDRLIYGLTPVRFGYMVVAALGALAAWSAQSLALYLRGPMAAICLLAGAATAWGRFGGRPLDGWLADLTRFVLANYRLRIRSPRKFLRSRRQARAGRPQERRPACSSPGLDAPP